MFDPNQSPNGNGNPFGNRNQNGGWGNPNQRQTQPAMPIMTLAAVVCGVIGIFTVMTGMFSLIFGSLAILFAFLSRGSAPKMTRPARIGLIIGLVAVAVSVIIFVYEIVVILNQYGSLANFYSSYLELLEETYGINLE